jgi:crotonobetainyl-CoA:carnitine CoA-transferase CaiB-like acyl-CoA transferase
MPPLDGIRVVDLTHFLAGPYCTMLLGDMGADVIKVEEPDAGDYGRAWAPFVADWSTYFLGVNRCKRSITVDLKSAGGKQVFRRLLAQADVFIENLRPGSLTKMGFGYSDVQTWHPGLVYCSITGYGHTGPRRDLPGMDPIIQAEGGVMDITGFSDGPPTRVPFAITDYLAGLYAHIGILVALRDRDKTGLGQHVDIALYDAMISVLSTQVGIMQSQGTSPPRQGNDHPTIAPYETLCVRGQLVMVAAPNPGLWDRLCQAIDAPHLSRDPRFTSNTDRVRNRAALKAALEKEFDRYAPDELVERLRALKIPCGLVRGLAEAMKDPQIAARQMLLEFDEPVELRGFRVLGNPVKMSRTPADPTRRPPRLGEHTEAILHELGFSEAEVFELRAAASTAGRR